LLDAKEWLDVFPALDNEVRFNMLIYLSNEGPKSFSQVKKEFKIPPSSVEHHLDKLMNAQLIINSYRTPSADAREYSYYHLTERGKKILAILLEDKKP
jgi:DNA-binding MarR family transcriptional regulator